MHNCRPSGLVRVAESRLLAQSASWSAWLWPAITLLIGLVWLRRHADLNTAQREKVLTPDDAGSSDAATLFASSGGASAASVAWPRVSMLVAAKDEEANIGRCIAGLRAQDYPNLELIFVNDRSTDRTPQLIDAAAAADPRIVACHVKELRAGWFGKNNAMREGAARAGGEYLCFSDADCAFDAPQLVRAAVRHAVTERIDFLSVLPRLEAVSFWERVIQPVAGGVLLIWYPPRRVNDPNSPTAYANGAFMLLRRSTYDALGGHEHVRTQVNEDMHLARRAKSAGFTLRSIRSQGLYRVRMYAGFAQIWRGWSRIFYGCFGTFPRLLATLVFLALFSLSPYVTLAASAATQSAAGVAASLLTIGAQQSVLWRFWRLSGIPAPWALTYPLGAAVCAGMVIAAMAKLGGLTTTTWRGTTYRGQTLHNTSA
ncbi:MAG: hypothetical protein CHACPFDD_03375 [Phycisphaerae bacterium]|nr:hypothetical protein [Phycisphaerae bacterium]